MRGLVIGSLALGALLGLYLLTYLLRISNIGPLPWPGDFWGSVLLVVVPLLLFWPLYFLPSLMARGKQHGGTIFALNLVLGWTFLGWIGALVWAATDQPSTAP